MACHIPDGGLDSRNLSDALRSRPELCVDERVRGPDSLSEEGGIVGFEACAALGESLSALEGAIMNGKRCCLVGIIASLSGCRQPKEET